MDNGVQRYIDTKKNVLRNMERIQNILAQFQGMLPAGTAGAVELRKIQMILDDPFAANGSLAST